jgi:hypothetical protein
VLANFVGADGTERRVYGARCSGFVPLCGTRLRAFVHKWGFFLRYAVPHYFKDALRAPFFGGGKKNFLL